MNESQVRTNSITAWVLAVRPKTLTACIVPVVIGICLAANEWLRADFMAPAVLCLLFALVMQIDANFVNDYFDFVKGVDDEHRLGPKRSCAQGWITPRAMQKGIAITTTFACCVGLPLIIYGGWTMVVVGLACVVFCFLYTIKLSHIGLGDILVLMFFGIVPVCVTYYLTALSPLNGSVVIASMACGLVVDTLLVINNYRDIDNDRNVGKKTLAVVLGTRNTRRLYLWLGIVAFAFQCGAFCYSNKPVAAFLPALYLIPHTLTFIEMRRINKSCQLNSILSKTSRNILLFGLLTVIGLLVELHCENISPVAF